MKISEVICALEQFAPLPLQESFDNAGLQVGLTDAEVSGALLCLDVTEAVVDEAMAKGCNLIVSHHPLLFHKLSRIAGENYIERIVIKALRNGIVIASMHTNIDNARGGVNFKIAEKLGLRNVRFFGEVKNIDGVDGASGVVGDTTEPIDAQTLAEKLKSAFHARCVIGNEPLRRPINKIAICGGAGSFLIDNAISAGADAFVTGEAHYHDYFGHEQQLQIFVIGHYESEQYTSEIFKSIIKEKCPDVPCHITTVDTNPITYF